MKLRLALYLSIGLLSFRQDSPLNETWPKPELKLFPNFPEDFELPTKAEVQLGRYLFYDPILSADSTFSCSSCHQQEYAFADGDMRFSRGIKGRLLQRNTPALFNLIWYPSFFWDGRAKSLEDQAFHPLRHPEEMNLSWSEAEKRISRSTFYPELFARAYGSQAIDSNLIVKSLAAFQSILFSQNSKYDKVLRGEAYFSALEYQGFQIANLQNKGDCQQCHSTDAHALGTNLIFSNNGLDAALKSTDYSDTGLGYSSGTDRNGWFKVPSLRNLVFTAPYMHDGRFETLEELIEFYSEGVQESYNIDSKMQHAHQGGARLNSQEKKALLAFLKTLTDSSFISDSRYSNPFTQRP